MPDNNTVVGAARQPNCLRNLRIPRRSYRYYGNAAATWLWFTLVCILSFLSPSTKGHLETRGSFHVPSHVIVFAVSTLVACRHVRYAGGRVVTSTAVIAYGWVIEAMQSRIYGAALEWGDVASDACGVLVAFALTLLCLAWFWCPRSWR